MAVRWTAAAMLEGEKGLSQAKGIQTTAGPSDGPQSPAPEGIKQQHSCSATRCCVIFQWQRPPRHFQQSPGQGLALTKWPFLYSISHDNRRHLKLPSRQF